MKAKITFGLMLCCLLGWTVECRDVFVVAPNIFRLGVEEKIVLAVHGEIHGETIEIYVQSSPGKRKNLSSTIIYLPPGKPEIATLTIKPEDVEDILTNGDPSYVNLVAHGSDFHKEALIPLSIKSGYVFLQTDKLIYAPKQRVLFRIITLNEEAKPIKANLRLQIQNPNNVVVHNHLLRTTRGFVKPYFFIISAHPMFGKWSATVLFGYKFQQNITITFEVTNYVLPTFTIKLDAPEIILPTDTVIPITVYSSYLYGEPIAGVVTILLGIKNESSDVKFFGQVTSKALVDGKYTFNVNTSDLKRHKDVGWFPNLEGAHFIVKATVIDFATGQKEVEIDKKLFTSFPLVISFKRCLKDFKPGLLSAIEADLIYASGHVAVGIKATLTGTANENLPLKIYTNESISDGEGKIWFEIQPELSHTVINVEVKTQDPKFEGMQAIGRLRQEKFVSQRNAFIAILKQNKRTTQPGSLFAQDIYIQNSGTPITDIYFLVSARGKILLAKKMSSGQFINPRVEFIVTYEMVPSFQLVIFCHSNGELIADTRRVDVVNVCDPKASVDVDLSFYSKTPGSNGKITFHGTNGTIVGILGVNSGVNTLSDENLLTKSKMFKTFGSHDLGCGPGGGLTTDIVLSNAGLVILSNYYSPQHSKSSCNRSIRKKRELASTERTGSNGSGRYIDQYVFTLEDEDEIEKNAEYRKSFREIWLFTEIGIGSDGQEVLAVSLPHSITSWVIHAVSVSPNNGMCVADLKELKSMKKIFIQLNLPHSVVRYEQIEIKATVFNYGPKKLLAIVYMYGVKELCSGFVEDEKSERKHIVLDVHSAQSIYFPIIPLKAGTYNIKVVAITYESIDIVVRELNVVPEGYQIERHITVLLDPYNQQSRPRQNIYTEVYSDSINNTQGQQVSAINLKVPEDIILDSASCTVSIRGDQFIPVAETCFKNPEIFLLAPRGNGEINMNFFALTVYTIQYLILTEKVTDKNMEERYDFVMSGYTHQLKYRKTDGSFGGWFSTPSSTWLTAFVTKVFCQSSELIYIDSISMCAGISWLMSKQNLPDGSFEEVQPVYHKDMMGGIIGKEALTAYVLLTLKSCKCNIDTSASKEMAVHYLESILNTTMDSSSIAIIAYVLSLYDSHLKYMANDKLLAQGKFDAHTNTLHWNRNSVASIEATSYALLTQLQFNDMVRSYSIVNWLNVQQFIPAELESTQDTVLALNALSEYAIKMKLPKINLTSNLSLSNDKSFYRVLNVDESNSHILQEVKVNKIGGILYVQTSGIGIGFLDVKLTFNVPSSPEKLCKFNVTVNVSDAIEQPVLHENNLFHPRNEDIFDLISDNPSNLDSVTPIRSKRDGRENLVVLNITICVRYLGEHEAEMSFVDAGMLPGFNPIDDDLKALVENPNNFIDHYDVLANAVLFHLRKVSHTEPYCFAFRIKREFVAGSTLSRVVKVYDSYKPEELCSVFYSPDNRSPLLRKICVNQICICAEGGCPPKNPFSGKKRSELYATACDDHDYVWKGKVINNGETKYGFRSLEFQVQEVLKAGIESTDSVKGQIRILIVNSNCGTGNLVVHQEYIIMGKDGETHGIIDDEKRRNYLLDKSSKIQMWMDIQKENSQFSERRMQRDFFWLKKELQEEEC